MIYPWNLYRGQYYLTYLVQGQSACSEGLLMAEGWEEW